VAVYSLIYGQLYPLGIGESIQWNYTPPSENPPFSLGGDASFTYGMRTIRD